MTSTETSTCLERCRGLWGVAGEGDADKTWWANLVRTNVAHDFFMADDTFPDDMARYVLDKIVRKSDHVGSDQAKELLLSLCKDKRITKPAGACKAAEDRRYVQQHFQTYLKAFFRNMRSALLGKGVAVDGCFATVFLENVLWPQALPSFQTPTLSRPETPLKEVRATATTGKPAAALSERRFPATTPTLSRAESPLGGVHLTATTGKPSAARPERLLSSTSQSAHPFLHESTDGSPPSAPPPLPPPMGSP